MNLISSFGAYMKDPSNLFGAIWVLVLMFGSLSLTPPLLQAQSSDGTLVGTVTDQSDAAIPNATVKVISSQYGFSREIVTNAVGAYRIEGLQPGTYSVTFNAPGFAVLEVGGVILNGSVTTTANGKLQVGAVSRGGKKIPRPKSCSRAST